jgi:hypothetical protein
MRCGVKNVIECVFLGGALAVTAACTSMSAMQSARVVPEGQYRFLVAGGLFRTPVASPTSPADVNYPFIEGGARFGFTPEWDIGLRYTIAGMFTGDLKYEWFSDSEWAFSLGASLGYLATPSKDSSSQYFGQDVFDIGLPFYLSYDFSPSVGAFVSPRWVYRVAATQQQLVGAALGVRIGDRVGVIVEFSGAVDVLSSYRQYQLGLGFFFGAPSSVSISSTSSGAAL